MIVSLSLTEFINEELLKYPRKKWGKHELVLSCIENYDHLAFFVEKGILPNGQEYYDIQEELYE